MRIASLVLALMLTTCLGLTAQEYIIGTDDVVAISFWQYPSLNSEVRVGLDGRISLDIIGQIEAAGKTTEQLQADIVRQISRLHKDISQALVRVVQYNHNYVFVIGQVSGPGKMSFEVIPDLWTVINEAGGVTEMADLTRVAIVRGGADAGRVDVVNVKEAIENEQLDRLPEIRREDTIEIPRMPARVPSPELAQSSEKKNVVYVIGAVNSPGVVGYQDNLDILEVLAMAGGPSEAADLKRTKLITKDGLYAKTVTIDLDKYASSGQPVRYLVQKEDALILPTRGAGTWGVVRSAATILGVLGSAALIYDRLANP